MDEVQKYWENRYATGGNSGAGSYGMEAAIKANIINAWINQYDMRSVNEIGCGDGNNLLLYDIKTSYTGFDLSKTAVAICNEKTRKIKNSLKYYFTNEEDDMDYDADLCLLLDVWYHLTDEEVFNKLCHTLFVKGNWKYIIAYNMDSDSQFTENGTAFAPHLKNREFLSKVQEYPEWEVMYWMSGLNTKDGKTMQFPSTKKFFLLRRKDLEMS